MSDARTALSVKDHISARVVTTMETILLCVTEGEMTAAAGHEVMYFLGDTVLPFVTYDIHKQMLMVIRGLKQKMDEDAPVVVTLTASGPNDDTW